jgi:hypothetical protein
MFPALAFRTAHQAGFRALFLFKNINYFEKFWRLLSFDMLEQQLKGIPCGVSFEVIDALFGPSRLQDILVFQLI